MKQYRVAFHDPKNDKRGYGSWMNDKKYIQEQVDWGNKMRTDIRHYMEERSQDEQINEKSTR